MENEAQESENKNSQEPENKNLARDLPLNAAKLTAEVAKAPPSDIDMLMEVVHRLRDMIWGGDIDEAARQQFLYGSKSWDELKMAVMDDRFLPLPSEMVPETEETLRTFCSRLLDRHGDYYLLNHFVRGWCGADEPRAAFDNFVRQLWATRQHDEEFFNHVVRGLHGSALAYLRTTRIPVGLTSEQALELIARMALIWCAHDVQATAARARRVSTKPFGWLLSGAAKQMQASTVFSVMRPIYRYLTTHLDRYRTNEEATDGKAEGKSSRHNEIKTIKLRADPLLNRSFLRGEWRRRKRDELQTDLRNLASSLDDEFWTEVRLDKPSGKYDGMHLSQVWYTGLLPLPMVALSVLRLLQAEALLLRLITDAFHADGRHADVSDAEGDETGSVRLPPFEESQLLLGWKSRARLLVDSLRRAIVDDGNHQSQRRWKKGDEGDTPKEINEPPHDDNYLEPASTFLTQTREDWRANDPKEYEAKRQTLGRLDVALNLRFAR